MKKKINRYMVLAVCLTLLSTILMTVGVFHHMYREQVLDDLKNYAEVICGMTSSGEELSEHYMGTDPDVRVTVISAKGDVLYDSQTGDEVLAIMRTARRCRRRRWAAPAMRSDILTRSTGICTIMQ